MAKWHGAAFIDLVYKLKYEMANAMMELQNPHRDGLHLTKAVNARERDLNPRRSLLRLKTAALSEQCGSSSSADRAARILSVDPTCRRCSYLVPADLCLPQP